MSKHTDNLEQSGTACVNQSEIQKPWYSNIKFAVVGMLFGVVFVKAEIVSWFRIQEMFRFDSFHMYGVIGTAIAVGMISLQLLKRMKIKSMDGEEIVVHDKKFDKGQIYGGFLFGLGWALTGACPGPESSRCPRCR